MQTQLIFKNGKCSITLTPEGDWEQRLVGALSQGKAGLKGTVTYNPEGHYANQRGRAIAIKLEALPDQGEQPDE